MFSLLNDITLGVFSTPFTYKRDWGDVELTGVFSEKTDNEGVGGGSFTDHSHTLQLQEAVVIEHDIELRKTVVVKDVSYQIIDSQTDVTGLTTLSLRRYQ